MTDKVSIKDAPCPCDCACHKPGTASPCGVPLDGTEHDVEDLGTGGRFICLFCYTTCEGVE